MGDEALYLAIKMKVKAATKSILNETDWQANFGIVDMLTNKPSYAEYVARVLRKRIRHWDPAVGNLALSLAETIVKNCPTFHPFAADPSFIDSMLKELHRQKPKKTLLQKVKVQTPHVSEIAKLERRDKILLLLKSWGKAFQNSSMYPIFWMTYQDLLRQNFRFPQPLKDEVSPVFTPQAKPRILSSTDTSGPIKDDILQQVLANIELFTDTLNETNALNLDKDDAVQALRRALITSQVDILSRIDSNPNEELLKELLSTNDQVCQSLTYYDGLVNGSIQPNHKHKKRDNFINTKKNSHKSSEKTPKSGPLVADILGIGMIEPSMDATNDSSAYETSSESDDEEHDSEDDSQESEDEENNNSLELVKATKLLTLQPPPSSGKGKSRTRTKPIANEPFSSTENAVVVKDPWAIVATEKEDNPFAPFEIPSDENQQMIEPSQVDKEFMQLALRPSVNNGASTSAKTPSSTTHAFDPL